jgi:hypothetical protein
MVSNKNIKEIRLYIRARPFPSILLPPLEEKGEAHPALSTPYPGRYRSIFAWFVRL